MILYTILGVILLLIAIVIGLFGTYISRFYFYPTKVDNMYEKYFDLPYKKSFVYGDKYNEGNMFIEEIEVRQTAGKKLFGLYRKLLINDISDQNGISDNMYSMYRNGISDKVILYLHGNAGNMYMRANVFEKLPNHSLLMIDYSGFGKSQGIADVPTVKADVEFAYQFLLNEGFQEQNIILFGESIGCCLACYLCTKFSPSKIVLQSGPSSINDVLNHMFSGLGTALSYVCDDLNAYKFLQSQINMKKIPTKVLILHSRADEVVPFSCGEKMYSLPLPTEFKEIRGGHNDSIIDFTYVNDWINK